MVSLAALGTGVCVWGAFLRTRDAAAEGGCKELFVWMFGCMQAEGSVTVCFACMQREV